MQIIRTSEWRFSSPSDKQDLVNNLRWMYDREATAEILGCTIANVYYHGRKIVKRT
jgi:hypothetical protein